MLRLQRRAGERCHNCERTLRINELVCVFATAQSFVDPGESWCWDCLQTSYQWQHRRDLIDWRLYTREARRACMALQGGV